MTNETVAYVNHLTPKTQYNTFPKQNTADVCMYSFYALN